jgi:simple sugar transport system ATP-binding protein
MKENMLVDMVGINKSFGKVQALKGVNVSIGNNEILGLLGDNGAGKSTLINILTGIFPTDAGEIYFEGKKVNFDDPQDAIKLGIITVSQHLSLVDVMSISRNFFLGREPTKKIGPFEFLDTRKMDQISKNATEDIGVQVRSAQDPVSNLSGGERQSLAIGRAFYFGCKLLLLDEPLAALSIREGRKVHDMILKAREAGTSVVYITHNVYHVYSIADRFVLLDRGNKIGETNKEEMSPEDIIETIAMGKMVNQSQGESKQST